jgi:hypothetical protein
MSKLRVTITALIITVLFVSSIAGTIFYYNGVVNQKDSEISSLNNQIANLTSQISSLNDEIANLTTANLNASLVVGEYSDTTNFLNLDGSVANVGEGTAYNAGLHVIAYDAQGVLQINATVPLAFEETFTNPYGNWEAGSGLIGGSHSVTSLNGGQTAQIRLNIDHAGTVTNWTITPVWTNSP